MTFLMGLLGLIPGVTNLLASWVQHTQDIKLKMYTARLNGDVDAARAMLQAEVTNNQTKVSWLTAVASSPFLWLIIGGFALPYIIYEWQAIVVDKVINHGLTSTDPIRGNLADWGDTILKGIFISGGAVGSVQAWINRK